METRAKRARAAAAVTARQMTVAAATKMRGPRPGLREFIPFSPDLH